MPYMRPSVGTTVGGDADAKPKHRRCCMQVSRRRRHQKSAAWWHACRGHMLHGNRGVHLSIDGDDVGRRGASVGEYAAGPGVLQPMKSQSSCGIGLGRLITIALGLRPHDTGLLRSSVALTCVRLFYFSQTRGGGFDLDLFSRNWISCGIPVHMCRHMTTPPWR